MPKAQTLGQRMAQARREKAAREHRDIQQVDVADAVGVGKASVSRYENDVDIPREATLAKIAAFLDTTPQWLRYGISDVVMVGGLPIDRSTITTFTPEQIAALKRELAEEEAARAPKPDRPKKRNNG